VESLRELTKEPCGSYPASLKEVTVDQVRMALAYRRLKDFAKLAAPFPWIEGSHIDLICEKLEAVERKEMLRLIINIPPGYAKSYLCSRCFPTWVLLRHPDWEFLLTSYGDDLAEEHSAAARQYYTYWAPQITGASVEQRSQAVDRWLVDAGPAHLGGGMRACGIMSAVTGRRADIAVVDDPFKNWKEASSAAHRDTVMQNYRSAIRNRLRPKGAIVIIHTRWHKDDLTGRLLEEAAAGTGEQWEVLKLAARAMVDDPLGRLEGEPLWPEFYNEAELDAMEKATGHFFWMAQHQQEPEDPEGRLFKRDWLLYFDKEADYYCLHGRAGDVRYHEAECVIFQTVDTNGSKSTSADYFVISTWALCPGSELLLLDVYREHIGVEDHLTELTAAYELWHPGCQYVENKTFGTNLIAAALAAGLPVYETNVEVDKLTRAVTILSKYKMGMVYHRAKAKWLPAIEHELLEFPGGRHDDFIDTASDAGIQSVELGAGFFELPTVGGAKRVGTKLGADEADFR